MGATLTQRAVDIGHAAAAVQIAAGGDRDRELLYLGASIALKWVITPAAESRAAALERLFDRLRQAGLP